MKKIFKFSAILLGAFTTTAVTTSCEKQECCEWTDSYGDSYKYCEDDAPIYGLNWDQIKALATAYGADCEKEKV